MSVASAAQSGLVSEEERAQLVDAKLTVASGPEGDGKKDRYPSRSRAAWAFQQAHRHNAKLLREGAFTAPHEFFHVAQRIEACGNVLEQSEHLALSLLPLPYAQAVAATSHQTSSINALPRRPPWSPSLTAPPSQSRPPSRPTHSSPVLPTAHPPYPQLTRLASLTFVLVLPFSLVNILESVVIPFCFAVSVSL